VGCPRGPSLPSWACGPASPALRRAVARSSPAPRLAVAALPSQMESRQAGRARPPLANPPQGRGVILRLRLWIAPLESHRPRFAWRPKKKARPSSRCAPGRPPILARLARAASFFGQPRGYLRAARYCSLRSTLPPSGSGSWVKSEKQSGGAVLVHEGLENGKHLLLLRTW